MENAAQQFLAGGQVEGAVQGVAVRIDVGHIVPVALVLEVEAHRAHRPGVGHRPADIRGFDPLPEPRLDLGDDRFELLAEHDLRELGDVQLRPVVLVCLPDLVQPGEDILQHRHAVGPAGRLLVPGAAHQIHDDRPQNLVRSGPLHIVQSLEHLVGEIEGVAVAGEVEVRGCGEHEIRDDFPGILAVVEGDENPLRRAPVALIHRPPEPALERPQVRVILGPGKGKALPPRAARGAVGDLREPVDQKEILVFRVDILPQVGSQGENSHPR